MTSADSYLLLIMPEMPFGEATLTTKVSEITTKLTPTTEVCNFRQMIATTICTMKEVAENKIDLVGGLIDAQQPISTDTTIRADSSIRTLMALLNSMTVSSGTPGLTPNGNLLSKLKCGSVEKAQ